MKAANVVLYTVAATVAGVQRKPLASCAPDDASGALLLQHAAVEAIGDAKARGVPAPDFECLLEEREANEQGLLVHSSYTPLDPRTGKPTGEDPTNTREERDAVHVARAVLKAKEAADALAKKAKGVA